MSSFSAVLNIIKAHRIFREDNSLAPSVHIRNPYFKGLFVTLSRKKNFLMEVSCNFDDKVIRVLIKIFEKKHVLVIDTSQAPSNTPLLKHQTSTARRLKRFRFSCLKLQFSRDFGRLINSTIGISRIQTGAIIITSRVITRVAQSLKGTMICFRSLLVNPS